ncbi:HIT domain-containing protein [Candidatus Phycosocius spiralis]|uniref:HIT domain-containing protein n=1 Tax=Candidatus Phycosocius spiralis TaxID=2815099 RepID=A0ABQ4PW37_9PROT|nr:HIT family protein [Candidatus Phycosocius spiralis]GIU67213.1 HIT domain-containing protein [Candidatus Phycosocius spiralis]
MAFVLDPRLEAETLFAVSLPICDVRVMNDARYAWLIGVPRLAGATEWHDLHAQARMQTFAEVMALSHIVSATEGVEKVNIGALGNIVRQFHVHIIGRKPSDPAWPGPVWGHSPAQPYETGAADALIQAVKRLLPWT